MPEVAAQEQISAALYSFQTAAQADGLALSMPLTDVTTCRLGNSLLIDGEAFLGPGGVGSTRG